MKFNVAKAFERSWVLCLIGAAALALLTIICFQLHAIPAVAAVLYMVISVLVSLRGGPATRNRNPATLVTPTG